MVSLDIWVTFFGFPLVMFTFSKAVLVTGQEL